MSFRDQPLRFVPPTLMSISFWLNSAFVVTMLAQWMTMDSNPSGIAKNVFNEAISQRFPSTISTSYSAFMIICNSDGSSAVYP